ncbi:hypothetical protein Anapl_06981 [Anas platyrhynchos]|uniref:Uncharacterized protein n=1 Tax=Anas platyrhynchos TaxID=8839 RepID=R0M7Q5_ANAPL|nr:hypothetical protein Anapl_06981 [Anas platyrhynchos]
MEAVQDTSSSLPAQSGGKQGGCSACERREGRGTPSVPGEWERGDKASPVGATKPCQKRKGGELASLFTAPTREASEPTTSISPLPVSNSPLQRLLLATGLGTGHQDSQPLGLTPDDPSLHAREPQISWYTIPSTLTSALKHTIHPYGTVLPAHGLHTSHSGRFYVVLAASRVFHFPHQQDTELLFSRHDRNSTSDSVSETILLICNSTRSICLPLPAESTADQMNTSPGKFNKAGISLGNRHPDKYSRTKTPTLVPVKLPYHRGAAGARAAPRYNSYFGPLPLKENKTISDSTLALELFGFYKECLCAREMATLWFFLTALVYSSGGKPRGLREPRAASPPVPDVPKAGLCGRCSDSSTEGFFVCSLATCDIQDDDKRNSTQEDTVNAVSNKTIRNEGKPSKVQLIQAAKKAAHGRVRSRLFKAFLPFPPIPATNENRSSDRAATQRAVQQMDFSSCELYGGVMGFGGQAGPPCRAGYRHAYRVLWDSGDRLGHLAMQVMGTHTARCSLPPSPWVPLPHPHVRDLPRSQATPEVPKLPSRSRNASTRGVWGDVALAAVVPRALEEGLAEGVALGEVLDEAGVGAELGAEVHAGLEPDLVEEPEGALRAEDAAGVELAQRLPSQVPAKGQAERMRESSSKRGQFETNKRSRKRACHSQKIIEEKAGTVTLMAFASFSAQDGWDSLNRHLQSDSLSAELPGASDTSFDSIPVCATQVPVLGYGATHLNQTKLGA